MIRLEEVKIEKEKVQRVVDWLVLRSMKDVQKFLGLANYYRQFVKINLVKEFEKEIRKEKVRRVQMRKVKKKKKMLNSETEMFKKSELSEKYIVKILFG